MIVQPIKENVPEGIGDCGVQGHVACVFGVAVGAKTEGKSVSACATCDGFFSAARK